MRFVSLSPHAVKVITTDKTPSQVFHVYLFMFSMSSDMVDVTHKKPHPTEPANRLSFRWATSPECILPIAGLQESGEDIS
jgi:hypothetical protein